MHASIHNFKEKKKGPRWPRTASDCFISKMGKQGIMKNQNS